MSGTGPGLSGWCGRASLDFEIDGADSEQIVSGFAIASQDRFESNLKRGRSSGDPALL